MSSPRVRPEFQLGRVVITAGLLYELEKRGGDAGDVAPLLHSHLNGRWGELDTHDCLMNEAALREGTRVLSRFSLRGLDVYVITDGETDVCPACWAGIGECEPTKGEWVSGTHFRTDQPPRRVSTTVMRVEDY